MKQFWIVGQYKSGELPNVVWDFQGIFSTEEIARAVIARRPGYWYAPVQLDEELPAETEPFPGQVYSAACECPGFHTLACKQARAHQLADELMARSTNVQCSSMAGNPLRYCLLLNRHEGNHVWPAEVEETPNATLSSYRKKPKEAKAKADHLLGLYVNDI